MAPAFHLKSPADQVTEAFLEKIRNGEWPDKAPGILRLAADFGVPRSVVEEALERLVKSGNLTFAGRGKAMRVNRRKAGAEVKGSLVILSTPWELRSAENRAILREMETMLPAPVTRLLTGEEDPSREETARFLAVPAKFVILDKRGPLATALREAGRRVVVVGSAGPEDETPFIAVDHEALVREAFARAFAAGHKRVCMPLWRRRPEVIARIREWAAAAYAHAGLRHSPAFDLAVAADDTPAAMHACITELFRHTPPTALLLHDPAQWTAVFTTLASLGKVVPRDVSVICLGPMTGLDNATPSFARMRHRPELFVAALRAMLKSPASAPRQVMISPEWIPGDSLGPPPGSR